MDNAPPPRGATRCRPPRPSPAEATTSFCRFDRQHRCHGPGSRSAHGTGSTGRGFSEAATHPPGARLRRSDRHLRPRARTTGARLPPEPRAAACSAARREATRSRRMSGYVADRGRQSQEIRAWSRWRPGRSGGPSSSAGDRSGCVVLLGLPGEESAAPTRCRRHHPSGSDRTSPVERRFPCSRGRNVVGRRRGCGGHRVHELEADSCGRFVRDRTDVPTWGSHHDGASGAPAILGEVPVSSPPL